MNVLNRRRRSPSHHLRPETSPGGDMRSCCGWDAAPLVRPPLRSLVAGASGGRPLSRTVVPLQLAAEPLTLHDRRHCPRPEAHPSARGGEPSACTFGTPRSPDGASSGIALAGAFGAGSRQHGAPAACAIRDASHPVACRYLAQQLPATPRSRQGCGRRDLGPSASRDRNARASVWTLPLP